MSELETRLIKWNFLPYLAVFNFGNMISLAILYHIFWLSELAFVVSVLKSDNFLQINPWFQIK